jgi:hypothetical protein
MSEASLEQNMTAARREHLVPGREIHMQDMRGYQFCEVGLITGTSWMIDRLDVREAGEDRTFGGITGTWTGVAGEATMTQAAVQGSYYPGYMYRSDTFTFNRGTEVYLLDAPDGEVFVMQSFTRHWDPALSEDNLGHLGGRLDLPDGWGFRTETLDQDLEVSSAEHDNLAHVLQDNLHNAYQGSDVARAFSRLCREDSLW